MPAVKHILPEKRVVLYNIYHFEWDSNGKRLGVAVDLSLGKQLITSQSGRVMVAYFGEKGPACKVIAHGSENNKGDVYAGR